MRDPADREVLQIARSSFSAWLGGQPRRAQRAAADAELAERIHVAHGRDKTQGTPRINAELNRPIAPVPVTNAPCAGRGPGTTLSTAT